MQSVRFFLGMVENLGVTGSAPSMDPTAAPAKKPEDDAVARDDRRNIVIAVGAFVGVVAAAFVVGVLMQRRREKSRTTRAVKRAAEFAAIRAVASHLSSDE